MFSIIAAVGENLEIGIGNRLIWRIPEDMCFFRKTTINHKVLMGRRTFESLPGVLPSRKNIIVSRNNIRILGATCINDLDEFIEKNKNINEEIFVIGGSSIYEKLLPYANKIYLTEIFSKCPYADAYFPRFFKEEYSQERIYDGVYGGIKYQRNIYIKK